METVVVTGSCGKAGRAVVKDLVQDYAVISVDLRAAPDAHPSVDVHYQADLSDLGQCYDVLRGADLLVHMANIPAPDLFARERTFNENMRMNYNLFQAATDLDLERVVWGVFRKQRSGFPSTRPPGTPPSTKLTFPFPKAPTHCLKS